MAGLLDAHCFAKKIQKLLRISGQTWKCGDGGPLWRQQCIKRQSNGAETCVLHTLLILEDFAVAIGVQPYKDEMAHGFSNIGPRKHVCLHPATVCTGVSGEVDKDWLVLLSSLRFCSTKVIENPLRVSLGSVG